MNSSNFDLDSDVALALKDYPLLNWNKAQSRLIGMIELKGEDNSLLESFEVELHFTACFPFCFPLVWEIGGLIPREINRHVFPLKGNLCLGVRAEEIYLCMYGITTSLFITKVLLPRLADEYRVRNGQEYLNEYSHDNNGNWEYYFKKFNTIEQWVVLKILEMALMGNIPRGHEDCFCGSGKRFSRCHRKIIFDFEGTIKNTVDKFWRNQYDQLLQTPFKD